MNDAATAHDEASPTIRIEGEMTIYRAQEIHAQLLRALERPGPLEIDLSGVSEIDSAGLQLLAAAQAGAAARGAALRLRATSAAVQELFALLDLSPDSGAAGPLAD